MLFKKACRKGVLKKIVLFSIYCSSVPFLAFLSSSLQFFAFLSSCEWLSSVYCLIVGKEVARRSISSISSSSSSRSSSRSSSSSSSSNNNTARR